MKKLLMLGGGFLQNYVILKARSLGYYVYCLDANPNAIGKNSANEFDVINIVDEESCLQYAKEKRIDGVLTAATDFSVLTMSYIAQELDLPGINYNSAKTIKNKAKVRKVLFDNNVDDTSYSFEINSANSIDDILKYIKFPIMVKPVDGSGSRGASKVEDLDELLPSVEYAINSSISQSAVIEQFINGKEYGVESFVDNGEIHVLAIMQKEMTKPPLYAELGHAIPSGLSMKIEKKIESIVEKAIRTLGVNHGSINMDLLITKENEVHIVDVGARMGGNLIGSHIVPMGKGIDYMGNMIKAAVGDKTNWNLVNKPNSVATKLLALSSGKVKKLPNFQELKDKYNVLIEHHLQEGDIINTYRTNLDGCGYVVASADNVNDAVSIASKVKIEINNMIIREC